MRGNEFIRIVATPITTALKAAVHVAMSEQQVSKSELARRMRIHEKEARRMLDPKHPTKVPALERALAALGLRAEIAVSKAKFEDCSFDLRPLSKAQGGGELIAWRDLAGCIRP